MAIVVSGLVPSRDILSGLYQHYKGGYYLVLGLAHHSETMETMVVYVPLYVREGPRMAVRPVEMFFGVVEEVCPRSFGFHHKTQKQADQYWCFDCERVYEPSVKRFVYIGSEVEEG